MVFDYVVLFHDMSLDCLREVEISIKHGTLGVPSLDYVVACAKSKICKKNGLDKCYLSFRSISYRD